MRRTLAIALALCMLFALLPVTAQAAVAYSGTCGDDMTWTLTEDGTLTISGTGEMYDFEAWDSPWYPYADWITALQISDGVTHIGDYAFCGLSWVTELTIPDTVTYIGEWSLGWCSSLTQLVIPKSVTYINTRAFACCENLTEIRFLGHVRNIQEGIFLDLAATVWYPANYSLWTEENRQSYGGNVTWVSYEGTVEALGQGKCGDHLTWVMWDNGILEITGSGAIYDYTSGTPWIQFQGHIVQLKLDDRITAIGTKAFEACWYLQEVTIPGGVKTIGNRAFWTCTAMKKLIISEGVERIEEGAFMNCFSLHTVKIPDSVTYIGSYAFEKCGAPVTVEMEPGEETELPDIGTRDPNLGLREVYIGKGVAYMGDTVFLDCGELQWIQVDPENAHYTSDDRGVLFNKGKTELIQAPGGITGSYTVPDGVVTIGQWAFALCPNLTAVEIPESVETIGNDAFSSVPNVGFSMASSLREIRFRGDAPVLGDSLFTGITATVYYPAGNGSWTEAVMQDYGGTITWVPYEVESYSVEWVAANATLTGSIDLNFSAVLSDNLVKDSTFVRFTCAGKVVDVPMADAAVSVKNGQTRYRFGYKVYAKEMTETVTAQVMTPNGPVGEAKSYSVAQYCNALMGATKDAKIIAVCKAMLNYGAAAQKQFSYNLDNLANATLSEEDKVVAKPDASRYAYKIVGTGDGIKATSAKLTLDADVAIRVTFQITGGKDVSAYKFLIDGEETDPIPTGDRYYIELDGIAASKFDDTHIFSVGDLAVHYSVLSYVNMVHTSNSPENLVNLINALYAYYAATEAYVS